MVVLLVRQGLNKSWLGGRRAGRVVIPRIDNGLMSGGFARRASKSQAS